MSRPSGARSLLAAAHEFEVPRTPRAWHVPPVVSEAAAGGAAAAITLAATIGLQLLLPFDPGFAPLLAGVVVIALLSGTSSGLVATVLLAFADLAVLAPTGPAASDIGQVARLVVFVPLAVAISWIAGAVRRGRVQAEASGQALAEQYSATRLFKAGIDAAPMPVLVADGDLAVIYANRAATELAGQPLVGAPLVTLAPELTGARVRHHLPGGHPGSATLRAGLRVAEGDPVPVEVTIQAVRDADAERFLLVLRDLRTTIEHQGRLVRLATQERARVEELRSVIESMGDAVGVFAADGGLLLANRALADLAAGPFRDYRELERRLGPGEVRLPSRDGGDASVELVLENPRRWIEATLQPVGGPDPRSESQPHLLVLRDMTSAREARVAQEAFMGVLSHELRTPVTAIFGDAKLLARARRAPREDGMAAAPVELIDDIEIEADRLYRLIEDLLVLSRAERGVLTADLEPVNLGRVVAAAAEAEARRWPAVHVRTHLPVDLPAVLADATYIEQIVRNLVSNAAKYGPGGGADVEVEARVGRDEVEVAVLDEGSGFPTEEADLLFELFYRSPGAARRQAGSGIGLYVTRKLAEAMGGRVWARPRQTRGSDFGFALRIARED